MKPQYRTCPGCGANLDPQERCGCGWDSPTAQQRDDALLKKSEALQEQIRAGIRKDAKIRELTAALEAMTRRAETAETEIKRRNYHEYGL